LSEAARVLTPAALSFVAKLHRAFERAAGFAARRAARQSEFDAANSPISFRRPHRSRQGMDDRTAAERICSTVAWRSRADRPQNGDQRAQLGCLYFHADFEDANCPTWANMIEARSTFTMPCAEHQFRTGGKVVRLKSRWQF